MIQERALLHFNKFKTMKNEYLLDSMKGASLQILKVKLVKISEDDFSVKITVQSELDNQVYDIDSDYATNYLKEI
ncbi:MAG: hypothetical protein HN352_02995 [Bacteroidetes bacterium]|mgnify:FL=1|jgi:competence protein ComGF|nr:hypothetical protein [Bacteroidota bacterium]MBT3750289.1 hypothetical protein [Bacteroidota bacterium]MBT4398050.1 hypothetical protein [Bacteroidota bacterium]MBT4408659.1 hypothetical protein [Bacteroidota bacterium]MBT5427104.1 hypothetical protein [Bacteroidota bacterium]